MKKRIDNLEMDVIRATQAGMSYGQWKALHPNTQKENEPLIAALEEKLESCKAEQSRFASDFVKLQELGEEQARLEAALEEKTERWVYLNDLKEQIDAQ